MLRQTILVWVVKLLVQIQAMANYISPLINEIQLINIYLQFFGNSQDLTLIHYAESTKSSKLYQITQRYCGHPTLLSKSNMCMKVL